MEELASDGCHYEVSNAEDLVFFFGDVADQINGQKYIYVRIACPVDVTVRYQGQVLSSEEDELMVRTDFGTLTFEEGTNGGNIKDNRIKILRLKEGPDYKLRLTGTGQGLMDYTIGFMDNNGDYTDLREFEDIKITRRTVIDTIATNSDESTLNIDEDGDGNYELILRTGVNGVGKEVEENVILYLCIGSCALVAILFISCFVAQKIRKKKKG